MPKDKSRGWCFTINNPTSSDLDNVNEIDVPYIIVGCEVGEEGTEHLQGYLHYKEPVRFTQVKKALPRAHIEVAKGTSNEAIYYCMKDGAWVEDGERPKQGKRSDLDLIRHDLLTGSTPFDIAEKNFAIWCQYRKAFNEYYDHKVKFDTQVVMYDEDIPEDCEYVYSLPKAYVANIIDPHCILIREFYSKKYKYLCIPRSGTMWGNKNFWDKYNPIYLQDGKKISLTEKEDL